MELCLNSYLPVFTNLCPLYSCSIVSHQHHFSLSSVVFTHLWMRIWMRVNRIHILIQSTNNRWNRICLFFYQPMSTVQLFNDFTPAPFQFCQSLHRLTPSLHRIIAWNQIKSISISQIWIYGVHYIAHHCSCCTNVVIVHCSLDAGLKKLNKKVEEKVVEWTQV